MSEQSVPSRFSAQGLRLVVLSLLLAAATVAVYYPVNHFEFLNYDDNIVVTENLHVKYGLDWDGVKWAFTSPRQANWVPLTFISHALYCELFGLRPGPHHDVNLLLPVVDVLLLFWFLVRATWYIG